MGACQPGVPTNAPQPQVDTFHPGIAPSFHPLPESSRTVQPTETIPTTMNTASTSIRVKSYVRKPSLVAPVDSTLRTLDHLEDDGVIDEFDVNAWPGEVRMGAGPPHGDVEAIFEEFDAWAEQWNLSIRPPFSVETRSSEITGETRQVLITPVQCLAIYVNGVLGEVFPHSTDPTGGGETYTVGDALTLLEERDIRAVGSGPNPDTAGGGRPPAVETTDDPDGCPACGTQFVTGQGVYACPDCDWTGIATGPGQYRSIGSRDHHLRSSSSASSPRTGNENSPRPGGRG